MAAESNKRKPNESADGGGKKHDRWENTRSFFSVVGCWFISSIRNPDNIPAYLTAFATFLLAAFAFYAWDEATRGTRAMEGQLRAMQTDQRPYIYLTNTFANPNFFRNPTDIGAYGQILWTWQITNYGRGVAYHFRYSSSMKIGNDQFRLSYNTVELSDLNQEDSAIPTGKFVFGTIVSPPGYVQDQVTRWLAVDDGFVFLLKFEYFDGYGTKYFDEICIGHLATGAFSNKNPKDCKN